MTDPKDAEQLAQTRAAVDAQEYLNIPYREMDWLLSQIASRDATIAEQVQRLDQIYHLRESATSWTQYADTVQALCRPRQRRPGGSGRRDGG